MAAPAAQFAAPGGEAGAAVLAQDIDLWLLQRIEDSSLSASEPPQQRRLDGWIVRTCPGKAKRARSVQPVALGQRSVQSKLIECEALFREAGLPLVVRLTPFTQPPDLDARLARLGWTMFDPTRVMVRAALGGDAAQTRLRPGWTETAQGPQEFARIIGALRGSSAVEIAAHAQRLQHSPVPYTGLVWRDAAGTVQACGQCAREADLVGLYDIFTAPAARGQGLAGSLCARLLDLAQQQGARTAYLQVDAANAAARKVYARLGFRDAYAYHYRSSEAGAH